MEVYVTVRLLDKMLWCHTSLSGASKVCKVSSATLQRHFNGVGYYEKGNYMVRRVTVTKIAGRGKKGAGRGGFF